VLIKTLIFSVTNDQRVCDPRHITDNLCNPISRAGNLTELVKIFMADIGGVIGLIAIAMVVYAGFRMVMANGDKTAIEKAKGVLTYGIYGFLISVFAYSLIIAIESFLGVNKNVDATSTTPQFFLSQYSNLKQFLVAMLKNVMGIIGLVSLLMIIVNGFKYATSRGDTAQIDSAKKGLTWALAGLSLAILAYTLVSAVAKLIS
jgi:hypothetical protein